MIRGLHWPAPNGPYFHGHLHRLSHPSLHTAPSTSVPPITFASVAHAGTGFPVSPSPTSCPRRCGLSSAKAQGRNDGSGGEGAAPPPPLDNPDQRLTADAAALTTAFASVVQTTLVVPGLVLFYTWYLVGMFGWTAPAACYVYFIVASAVNW